MNLSDWTTRLAARGITVLRTSTVVPVELHAVLADGTVAVLRCRGTAVTLRQYDPRALQVALPASYDGRPEDAVSHEVLGPFSVDALADPTARLVLAGPPVSESLIDGRERFGWQSYEAGLLPVPAAAALFDELLASVTLAAAA